MKSEKEIKLLIKKLNTIDGRMSDKLNKLEIEIGSEIGTEKNSQMRIMTEYIPLLINQLIIIDRVHLLFWITHPDKTDKLMELHEVTKKYMASINERLNIVSSSYKELEDISRELLKD